MRDRRAAAIYAADKLANTRDLLDGGEQVRGERLDHYIKTLRPLSEGRPDLPFLAELSGPSVHSSRCQHKSNAMIKLASLLRHRALGVESHIK